MDSSDTRRDSSSGKQPRKRKASKPRPVSALTPSQLAAKRTRDCAAQRAARDRKKQQVESLESKVKELQSFIQEHQDVQKLQRQNEALEAELLRLRLSLARITSAIEAAHTQPNMAVGNEAATAPFLSTSGPIISRHTVAGPGQSALPPTAVPGPPAPMQTSESMSEPAFSDLQQDYSTWIATLPYQY